MSENKIINHTNVQPNIIGHDIFDIARYLNKTKHMIVFDVLSANCLIGNKNERIRIFLTNEGFKNALKLQNNDEIKIIHHAKVRSGILLFNNKEVLN